MRTEGEQEEVRQRCQSQVERALNCTREDAHDAEGPPIGLESAMLSSMWMATRPGKKKPPKGKGRGKGGLSSLDENDADNKPEEEQKEEGDVAEALDSDEDGEIGHMFLMDDDFDDDVFMFDDLDEDDACCTPCDPWTLSDP